MGETGENKTCSIIVEILCLTYVQIYMRTRGRELPGNYNAALLAELFREQSIQWLDISESHLHDILRTVAQWIQLAVERLIPDDSMRGQVHTMLKEWLENAEMNALRELEKLNEDEQRTPLTYNHYYTDNIQKARTDIAKEAMECEIRAKLLIHTTQYTDGRYQMDMDEIIAAVGSKITVDMDEQACNNAILELRSYYKVRTNSFFIYIMLIAILRSQ